MTDQELATLCGEWRTKRDSIADIGVRINTELGISGKALLVRHAGVTYSVEGRYTKTDDPRFEEIVIPETGV